VHGARRSKSVLAAFFPARARPCRTATLNLTNLAAGPHTLEVIGQDPAGNWQDADPATTIQVSPTSRTWTVNPALVLVQLNEILADSATAQPDAIELYNGGGAAVALDGWTLSDNPTLPNKYAFTAGTTIPTGGYLVVNTAQTGINIDKDGDSIYLYQGGVLKDSVTFGHQVPDLTIGRIGLAGAWTLCTPTLGGPNVAARTGSVSGIRINEWFSDGVVLYDNDWIELANTGDLPVDLSGMKLADNRAGSPHTHTLAPLSFIAANGYVKTRRRRRSQRSRRPTSTSPSTPSRRVSPCTIRRAHWSTPSPSIHRRPITRCGAIVPARVDTASVNCPPVALRSQLLTRCISMHSQSSVACESPR
jgi:hypothetical protein